MKRLVLVLPFLLMGASGCPPPTPTPTPTPAPTVEPTPIPTPTPGPTTDGCGAPAPPAASRINVKVHQAFCANIDSTILVLDALYCAQIGYTDRKECPVRMDGAVDKVACEARVRGPRQLWTCEGCKVYPCDIPGNCECAGMANTNPASAIVMGKGKLRTCTFDGKACGELVIQ